MTTPAMAMITLFPPVELLAAWLANGRLPCHRSLKTNATANVLFRALPFVPAGLSGVLYTLSGENPIKPGVCVESPAAQEPDERHPELPGDVDGEAARRRDGADDGHPGRKALLQDLERGAPADHHHVLRERQPPL